MTDATSPGVCKKPYVRRLTEARREQNRRAQKVFKEKRRKERNRTAQYELVELPPAKTIAIHPSGIRHEDHVYKHTECQNAGIVKDIVDISCVDIHREGNPTNLELPDSYQDLRHVSEEVITYPRTLISSLEGTCPISTTAKCFGQISSILTPLAPAMYIPADPGSVDMRAMWPIPVACYQQAYTPPPQDEQAVHFYSNRPKPTSFVDQTCSIAEFHAHRLPAEPSPLGLARQDLRVPCPYMNHLRLLGESTFAATMEIALSLGISRTSFINDHPSSFPLAPLASFAHIEPDLRPTEEQRTLAHPRYLDCIIFSSCRSRAIELSSRGELDHCSLFLDLMHGGMICHSGSDWANVTTERSMSRNGVPWNKQSWEVRPWFLRKWWFLIDDIDQADIIASNWRWAFLRGDAEVFDPLIEEPGIVFSRHGGCNVGIRQITDDPVLW